ncbi:MAG: ribosome small subunit-dependent GTPase A [Cellulomonadaceae bacterium]|nr:ribosome small subunit-dependent GTPase A [Cellulomonadaceae bacterium]
MRRGGDEYDAYERASRTATRPRTKKRPTHASATPGLVTGVDRGRYTLVVGDAVVTAMKARELQRERVVVGDHVDVVGDTSGSPGSLARIVRISERTSVLRRTADDHDPYERIVVANADQLMITAALADPPPRIGMIDRCVVAAYDAGMDVILCLTKSDLASPSELRGLYEPLGVRVLVTSVEDPESIEAVRAVLMGHVTVLLGHSGVGKSTLVNALVPAAERATGHVNEVTGRGRHTSSSAVALRVFAAGCCDDGAGGCDEASGCCDDGEGEAAGGTALSGWVVDTPGVRSLGLAHVEPENVLAAFEDVNEAAVNCPRGCTHLADAPDCALDAWVESGDISAVEPGAPAPTVETFDAAHTSTRATRAARLASLRRVLASRTATV